MSNLSIGPEKRQEPIPVRYGEGTIGHLILI